MKIRRISLCAVLLFFLPSFVFAAPPEFSGNAVIHFDSLHAAGSPVKSGTAYSLTLRGEQILDPDFSLFLRVGAQYAGNPAFADFKPGDSHQDRKTALDIDQFGLIYNRGSLKYVLGRQSASVGVTCLLYNRSDDNIGRNAFVDGFSVAGTIGRFDLSAIVAQENSIWRKSSRLYAFHGGSKLSRELSVGLTIAGYRDINAGSSSHWAADAAWTRGRHTFTAEFSRSDRKTANQAHALKWTYDFDKKTSLQVTSFRVEANGDMGGQSDFDNNNRGFHFGIVHAVSDKLTLEAIYKDQVALTDRTKNDKMELWLRYSF